MLAILPLAGKFSGFDAAIAFPGDVDGQSRVLEAVADSIGDDRIADHFAPVIERQLGSEQDGFVDRSFFEQFAQILGFGGRELTHPHVVQYDEIRFGELVAVAQVGAAAAGQRQILEPGRERHVQHGFAAGTRAGRRPEQ